MKKEEKDEAILAALLSNQTTKAAAAACGIGETQIYARLRDPAFKKRYDTARLEMLDEATARLQSCLCDCIDEIKDISTDPTNSAQIRLNACDMIIRNALKLNEQVVFAERLSAIEARLAE